MFSKRSEAGAERPGGRLRRESQVWGPGRSNKAGTIAVGRMGLGDRGVSERGGAWEDF